ncbi:MAG: hypothetical protein PGN12_14895 [Sphingomonas phyllosphaerae]
MQLLQHASFTKWLAHAAPQQTSIFCEAVMLYLVYLIAQYRNQTRARAMPANDTDVRRAA